MKKILIGLVVLFIIIQFVPVVKKPEVSEDHSRDIHQVEVIQSDVSNLLKEACYDCHSNETRFPWYANVAPVSWWLYGHIEEGRQHLNFSEWTSYDYQRMDHKLEDIEDAVEKGYMPLSSYTWMHRAARMDAQQVSELASWAKSYRSRLESSQQ